MRGTNRAKHAPEFEREAGECRFDEHAQFRVGCEGFMTAADPRDSIRAWHGLEVSTRANLDYAAAAGNSRRSNWPRIMMWMLKPCGKRARIGAVSIWSPPV